MSNHTVPTRVLYCESNADGTIGGSHYCLLYLVENLDRTQWTPTVVFQEEHALVPRFRNAAEVVIQTRENPVLWGLGQTGLAAAPVRLVKRAVNAVRYATRIAGNVRFLQRHDIRLLHLNNSITRSHDWLIAGLLARVPVIVHERGLPEYTSSDRSLARRLALIVPMSKWIENHMVERGVSPENIRTMYDGLNPAGLVVSRTPEAIRAEWQIGAGQPVIGIVGNIREWKGQETVVRAMIAIVKAVPDVVCLLVGAATPGDQPFKERLEGIIRSAGIERSVRFTGYQKDVPSFMNAMQFVIHASIEPEPFGMVVLEAMALQRAVVGSRAGGVIEMVVEGDTGYTFPPGDADTLAARAIELLQDPQKARQMGQRGHARLMSHFTLQRYMEQIHGAYRAILDRRSLPAPHPAEAEAGTR
jgi:glycosyltransferase involved in cell wall biosynthesis